MSLDSLPRRVIPGRLVPPLLGLLVAAGLLASSGCGKKGPPLPPLRHGPGPVTELSAHQRGKQVILTGLLPDRNQDGAPVAGIQEIRVFRSDRRAQASGPGGSKRSGQRAALKQFSRDARRIAVLSGSEMGKALAGRRVTFVDTDPVPGAIPEQGQDLTYAMVVVDAEKHASPLSLRKALRILPPPLPPSNLQSDVAEKRIRVAWEPPAAEGKEETALYNLYRTEAPGALPGRLRNEKPLPQPFFEDEDFAFGTTYTYVARSVIVEKDSSRESEDSLPLQVTPKDIYPPGVPTGLAVSAESGVIKLYWFPNSEGDLGGYRIYRSEKEGEAFEVIGSAGPAESAYIDRSAAPGVKYYYAVTAVDQSAPPNESARSEVHGDRLPAAPPAGRKPSAVP
jgi:hypothetical protein